MTLDGKKQRNALTAAENALRALASGDLDRAIRTAHKAAELDQIGSYAALPGAVERAAATATDSGVPDEYWDLLVDVLGPGPLSGLVAELRSSP